MSALFIGRFQPFHNGHLDALKQVLAQERFVVIAIGNAEDNFKPENPFTAGERYQMIETLLHTEKISCERYCIIPIRNISDHEIWAYHVKVLCPPFDRVYTGSPLVKLLFETAGMKVITIKKNLKISATDVRQRMIKNDNWEPLVPRSVVVLLKKWKAAKRLSML